MSMPRMDSNPPKKKGDRPSKEEYYLEIAYAVAKRSTCLTIQFGAVIVKDDCIVGTGYNGSARGVPNCCDEGFCLKIQKNGKRIPGHYTNCVAVHAEENAVINTPDKKFLRGASIFINATREPNPDVKRNYGGTPFSEFFPCARCMRILINARLSWVVIPNGQKGFEGQSLPYYKWNIPQYVKAGVFGGL